MIKASSQRWEVGATVRVGFLLLIVVGVVPTPGDYKPDQYVLTNASGDRWYRFTPHNGVQRIDVTEAQAAVQSGKF